MNSEIIEENKAIFQNEPKKESHWLDSIYFPNLYWVKWKRKDKAYVINNYPTKSKMIQVKEFLGNITYVVAVNNLIPINRLFTKDDGESFEVKDILKDLEEKGVDVFMDSNSDFKQHHYRDYYIKLYPFLKEKYDLFLKEEVAEINELIKTKEKNEQNEL